MKNKLELLRAAQDTALKFNAAKNTREKTDVITSAFDALKIDVKHFDTFKAQVEEHAYQFASLEKQLLEPDKAAAPAPAAK
jgi:hypothetical protein